jgi:CDP-glycerol glycerophosphotransferase (TagB/SpsB family)
MYKTLKHLLQAVKFMRLPCNMRRLVFYSEGANYWPLFQGLIDEILCRSNTNICYITSDKSDPGYTYKSDNYQSFLIDESYIRNWLFSNIQADVMVMTMPDLNQYQVKRSKHNVHYIYLQHALMSLHMAYRYGAFDYYDTIFCAGPHHVKEVRRTEHVYKLPRKKILKHGYARLDSIIRQNYSKQACNNKIKCAVFAPTWGDKGVIELGLSDKVIDRLLSIKCKVIFRPHPETLKSSKGIVEKIVNKYSGNKMFFYENSVATLDSFIESDFMVSDWSGSALEYSLGLNKPVVFLNTPKKINNHEYQDLEITPFEVSIREYVGVVVDIDDINRPLIDSLINVDIDPNKYVFNVGKSNSCGVDYILKLFKS